jgi:BsuBI/PstI restriction endonuclease domain/BsuBI/PstI restriction endonuclease HTH domain
MPAKVKLKPPAVAKAINEAIHILEACGLPLSEKTVRSREKTAMAFLAVAGVTHSASWSSAGENGPLGTRKIIHFINQHFGEAISLGSYDDIRRKDLADALLAELVIPSAANPAASVNDPTRGYALSPALKTLVRKFGQKGWQAQAAEFMSKRPSLADLLAQKAHFDPVPLELPDGTCISLSSGQHNLLQKAVVEHFLPRFGSDSQIVYIGDTAQKTLHVNETLASEIGLSIDPAAKIPDVIAYSASKNWLYLIEAVHSFGPISNQRRMALEAFAANSKAGLVFVTAFLDLKAFRKAAADIGWDTEVWIATEPDHLIHWNGDRFLGPRAKH